LVETQDVHVIWEVTLERWTKSNTNDDIYTHSSEKSE